MSLPSVRKLDPVTRRRFLAAVGGSAAGLAFALRWPDRAAAATERSSDDYPFTMGIASGDPLTDSVVLWTRIAPRPLEPYGGLPPDQVVAVRWQVANDEKFSDVVASGTAKARAEHVFTVHVDVKGLRPGRHYWYRFSALGHLSDTGRTWTAPASGTVGSMRFGFASCMNYRAGYFHTIADMANQDLDAVMFLGDYIYEYPVVQLPVGRQLPPDLPPELRTETVTLDQYRLRYALHKSQPEMIAAHLYTPWMVMWDDHEVVNDYESDTEAELLRQAAAYRAYWEHMPLRLPQRPNGPDARLHRRLRHGSLAQFDLLDARQYRSPQLQPGTIPDSPDRRDPARTILGTEQEQWFAEGVRDGEPARWHIAPQGVLMAVVNTANTVDAPATYAAGNWDGYQASQQRLLDAVARGRDAETLRNFVVLTGDVHTGYVSNLLSDTTDLESPSIGTEFTSLSITSAQDFNPDANQRRQVRKVVNPHMKWVDLHCGYVVADLDAERMRLEFRAVDKVSQPDDPVFPLQRFLVEDGVPEVQPG